MIWNRQEKQLHDLIKENLVTRDLKIYSFVYISLKTGGLSMICNRRQVKNETKLHPDGKTCQKIVGLDLNALYLWCLQQVIGSCCIL